MGLFLFIKGHTEEFRIRRIWSYLFNQAVNAVVKLFLWERRKKAAMGGYT